MSDYRLPLNCDTIVKNPRGATHEELDRLWPEIKTRIFEMTNDGESCFVLGFALRMDAESDPDYVIHVAEMEPGVEIRPYFKPKTSRYKGI